MAHFSENGQTLEIAHSIATNRDELLSVCKSLSDVCVITLPASQNLSQLDQPLQGVGELIAEVSKNLGETATLVVLGEVIDLVQVQAKIPDTSMYQHWIAIKRETSVDGNRRKLPHQHFGALVYTRYKASLRHTKTRIEYTYCPVCDKTTKDYGGKKHIYHEAGTLISDVWRDIACELNGDLSPIIKRFADLFGLEPYKTLTVIDAKKVGLHRQANPIVHFEFQVNQLPQELTNTVLNGDCLEKLRAIPENSIDFAFVDPPYNLKKKYSGYSDDLEIQDYFKWCDEWIYELSRVLKPGRTLALLNIPIGSIRHFLYMQTILKYQNWLVWDALAFPVRLIMPAHYTILCFTKGESRELPCFTGESSHIRLSSAPKNFNALEPLADDYCLRENCVNTRIAAKINDKTTLTDLWSDIHRLKHNSRRVDHPTQLPPHLMYRAISIFTKPNEVVLDCFNGSGTTTLTAHQLGRKYLGIEASEKYWNLSNERHQEILNGLDPFRKMERVLTSKNSRVARVEKQVYKVPKKTLQLEVKRVTGEIGHIPSRDELISYGKYSIEYYDKYFVSWGEVTAAARTTGMSEKRNGNNSHEVTQQLRLLEKKAQLKT
jgi:site-specific DNA-methyltransferase (adenine-specific)